MMADPETYPLSTVRPRSVTSSPHKYEPSPPVAHAEYPLDPIDDDLDPLLREQWSSQNHPSVQDQAMPTLPSPPGLDQASDAASFQRYLPAQGPSQEPSQDHRQSGQSWRSWLSEILSCVVSLICIIVIVVVLALYNGKPPPELALGGTLNSFVALFVSLSNVALIVPVMEGLGQLRWIWFSKKPRRLTDFERFDQACRWTHSGFRLLVSFKGGVLGFLASFLLVSRLMTSTITQQVIHYPTRLGPVNGTALIPRVTNLQMDYSTIGGRELTDTILEFKQNILTGAYTLPGVELNEVPPTCSSGDCVYPDFVSLGICTDVSDISEQITVERLPDREWNLSGVLDNTTWSATIPGNNTLTVPNLRSFDVYLIGDPRLPTTSPSSNKTELDTSLADLAIIYSNAPTPPDTDVSFHAVKVLLYWCAKGFSVNVTEGLPRWTEVARSAEVIGNTASSLDAMYVTDYLHCSVGLGQPCYALIWGNLTLAPPPGFGSHPPIVVEELTALGISAMFHMSFWSGVDADFMVKYLNKTAESDGGLFLAGKTIYRVQGDIGFALGAALWPNMLNDTDDPSLQPQALANFTNNMAKGIENYMRNTASGYTQNLATVNGTVLGSTPYVQVRWPWLLFLILELALASTFLLGTIVATRRARMQILKGSSLATICALNNATRRHLGGIDDFEAVRKRAGEIKVRLERGTAGAALWLAMEGDDAK